MGKGGGAMKRIVSLVMRARRSLPLHFLTLLFLTESYSLGQGVSVGQRAADNSIEAQLDAFRIHEDFEVSLFADESLGIANPVAMHWDEQGRLWVLTTLTYAQLEPGENPNDTLVILEDTDGDNRADQSTIFADGLDMPMGFALGNGGVYLGEGPDLLFLQDTDGDNKADSRQVLLTGFGTGDTHQNISNFTWGPDGGLWFAQGLHCYSRVETPWGIVRGDAAGFWRFDPETLRLDPYCFPSSCSQNPCGIVFDKTGALFIKSNNRELIYATPGLVPTARQKNLVPVASIGATPGKSMGGEYVDSIHLPEWIQNHVLIAGYYANRVTAFPLVKEGAGYAKIEPVEILFSEHGSFRPVEIRIGPDGAIYVADWFNPIIGHYQASLRHPDRDEEHGRIWRITAKGRELNDKSMWSGQQRFPDRPVPDAESDEPRDRLAAVLASANSDSPAELVKALRVLDHPRDRFLDYALDQTIHATMANWFPALEKGELEFEKPEHLAFALETLGTDEAIQYARNALDQSIPSEEPRSLFVRVVSRSKNPSDWLYLAKNYSNDPYILSSLADSAPAGRKAPVPRADVIVGPLLSHENAAVRAEALRLAGLWKLVGLAEPVREALRGSSNTVTERSAAASALVRLEGGVAAEDLIEVYSTGDRDLKSELLQPLATVAPVRAALLALQDMEKDGKAEDISSFLTPFFSRAQGTEALAKAVEAKGISKETASQVTAAMNRVGKSDEKLMGLLQDAMGITSGPRSYSPDFVAALVDDVLTSGDPNAGNKVYQRAELTCVACHQVEGVGGNLGPSLDAVGAGLTNDLLVESVLWPQRQLKEGYLSIV
ncbi:MAG: PVC-type heme-binding CxxCH protein, partial [Verrucomicrobiota bacterium]